MDEWNFDLVSCLPLKLDTGYSLLTPSRIIDYGCRVHTPLVLFSSLSPISVYVFPSSISCGHEVDLIICSCCKEEVHGRDF